MCDLTTRGVIADVVGTKTTNGEMFTAFDITLEVQRILKTGKLFDQNAHRHRHLKNDIHDEIGQTNYQRNLQNVGPADAYVYYPVGGDPSLYVPIGGTVSQSNAGNNFTIPVPTGPLTVVSLPVAVSVPAVVATNAQIDGRIGTPDARGTLCVSAIELRTAGFNCGDTAYVYAGDDQQSLVVAKVPHASQQTLTTYTVDPSNNVRISRAILNYVAPNCDSFDFSADGVRVFVKQHD